MRRSSSFRTGWIAACLAWIAAPLAGADMPHDPARHLAAITRQIERRPNAAELWYARGEVLRDLGHLTKALADYDRALELRPDRLDYEAGRAFARFALGAHESALESASRYPSEGPQRAHVAWLSGEILFDLGRYDEAERQLLLGLAQLDARQPGHFVRTADAQLAQGRAGALRALRTLEAGFGECGHVAALALRAIDAAVVCGQFERALAWIDELQRAAIRPESWLARRAEVLELAGRSDEAAAARAKALAAIAALPPRHRTTRATHELRARLCASPTSFAAIAAVPHLARESASARSLTTANDTTTAADLAHDGARSDASLAASIARGPYLQQATTSSAIVRWSTDIPTDSVLWLGPTSTSLVVVHNDPTLCTDHRVSVGGLAADTRYYYAVGSTNGPIAGGDADHHLRTLPPQGAVRPLRIWVIGDSGTGNANARAVRDAYLHHSAGRPTDVWLMLGDNAYPDGTQSDYQQTVFETYPMLLRNTFVWPTFGNHDARSASSATQSGVYYDIFDLPTGGQSGGLASGTEAYYSFDYGDVHFVCLDSHGTDRSSNGAMLTWLRQDLQNTLARWIVAYWHMPPYSKGSNDSDDPNNSGGRLRDMRENALPILEAANVDLVLCGHSHSYERSFLLDGHYGTSDTLTDAMKLDRGDGRSDGDGAYAKLTGRGGSHEGAVYVVAGSSGYVSGGPLNHPAMYVSWNELGSLAIEIDDDRLDARFLDDTGATLDHFSILRGVDRTLTRVEPRISAASGGTQQLMLDAGGNFAGAAYLVLGSFQTATSFSLLGIDVPLAPDVWFQLSAIAANSTVFANTAGRLDATGRASAQIVLPQLDPTLVGLRLQHAYLLHDGTGLRFASNAVRLTIDP